MEAGKVLLTRNQLAPVVLTQLNRRALIRLIGDCDNTITQRKRIAGFLIAEVNVEFSALAAVGSRRSR